MAKSIRRTRDRISKEVFAFESVFSEHAQTTKLELPTQIDPILPSVMADQVARMERESAERAASAKALAARKETGRRRVAAIVPGGVAVVAIMIAAMVGSFGQGNAHARAEVALVAATAQATEAPNALAPEIAAALGDVTPAEPPVPAAQPATEPGAQVQPEPNDAIEITLVASPVASPVARPSTRTSTDPRASTPSRASRSYGRVVPQPMTQPAPAAAAAPKPIVASAPAPTPPPAKSKGDSDFEAAARAAAQANKQLDSTLR
jgi:hypothetical protein